MAEIISLTEARKKKQAKKAPLGMCQHGFHRWKIDKNKQFDSKRGKLVTVYICERCGTKKVKGH